MNRGILVVGPGQVYFICWPQWRQITELITVPRVCLATTSHSVAYTSRVTGRPCGPGLQTWLLILEPRLSNQLLSVQGKNRQAAVVLEYA